MKQIESEGALIPARKKMFGPTFPLGHHFSFGPSILTAATCCALQCNTAA